MTTPQNRQLTKGGDGNNSTKENYTVYRLGTNDGEIRFGQIDKGTTTSGVYLNAKGTHVITLDNDGQGRDILQVSLPQTSNLRVVETALRRGFNDSLRR